MKRKRTIYIEEHIDKMVRVAAVEDDKLYGEYAEGASRLFLDKRRTETKWQCSTDRWPYMQIKNRRLRRLLPYLAGSMLQKTMKLLVMILE